MKTHEYNPKAREAFGKSLIDVSTAIFKAMILLFTVVPLAFVVKNIIENNEKQFSIISSLQSLNNDTFIVILVFYVISFFAAHLLRNEGLKQIHESENT